MDFPCTFLREIFDVDGNVCGYAEANGSIDMEGVTDISEFIDYKGKLYKSVVEILKNDGTYRIVKVSFKTAFLWKQKQIGLPEFNPN